MQTKFIKIYLMMFVASLLLAGFVYAEGDRSPMDSSYIFHLYYDNGQLVADRDAQFKYDVVPESFIPETLSTQFPFKGEIINLKGEIARTFQFDPRQGDPKFMKGTISVRAPYVPDAQKVVFYNSQNSQLLSIFVSDSSFCNDDGNCNPDVGEDHTTCPLDCTVATPVPTVSSGPSTGGGLLNGIIYLIIGLAMAGGFWYWWRKRQGPSSPESTAPPLQPIS
jgi:hypothetical protein